jgi:hypothetical protein
MARTDDELDTLVRQLPAPEMSADTREAMLAALMEQVDADLDRLAAGVRPLGGGVVGPGDRNRRRRRRRLVAMAAGAALVVAGAGTAVATLALQRAGVRDVAHCFPFVTSNFDQPGLGPDVTVSGDDTAHQALQLCAAEWTSGALVSTPPYAGTPGPTPVPAPPLVACVLPSGAVGVFPGPPQTCADLGLPASAG